MKRWLHWKLSVSALVRLQWISQQQPTRAVSRNHDRECRCTLNVQMQWMSLHPPAVMSPHERIWLSVRLTSR